MAIIEAAKRCMERGWKVFPVDGKIPTTEHGCKDASSEDRMAEIWWSHWPDRGIGLATGEPSGIWALDLDGEEAANHLRGLQDVHGDLPETVTSKTRNGWHLLFRMPEEVDVRNSARQIAPGVDVRGTGGYVVIPPSPHPDGGRYRWVEGRTPDDLTPVLAPDWLLAMVLDANKGPKQSAGPLPEQIAEGSRNETLASLAGSLRRRGASRDTIMAAIESENDLRCSPPLEQRELSRIADSIARYDPEDPPARSGHKLTGNGGPPRDEEAEPPTLELVDVSVLDRIREDKLKPLSVVPTPWPAWNRVSRGAGGGEGLAHGWHIIIGAASGAGKSLAATNLAARAVRSGEHVCFISLEMSQSEVLTRLLAIASGRDVRTLEHGKRFKEDAWIAASEVLLEGRGSIRVNRQPIQGLTDIYLAVEHYVDEGATMVITDYLQLAWVRSASTMFDQITEVSHTIRGLARKHEILSVGLSQVNRKMSFDGGDPKKEGLMGGSSLENDADQVLLLGAQKPYRTVGYLSRAILDKNRHGPQVEWDVVLDTETLQMREAMPDEVPHDSF